ncbi:MAG: alpha/beta fold hydrolase [Rhizobiaceae bacterium]
MAWLDANGKSLGTRLLQIAQCNGKRMFEGFTTHHLDVGDAVIHWRQGGKGPPLLLLHGFPQTHVTWHAIAPHLSRHFSLILPDLRGYGQSLGPEPDCLHNNYSKRAMAEDMISIMDSLGHRKFRLAGHDRGARVAYRLCLDHLERVSHFASLDTVPTLDIWEAMEWKSAIEAFHWPLLAQPAPLPERLIGSDPDFFLNHLLQRWAGHPDALTPEAVAQYAKAFRKKSVLQAMAEDYRAGATIDVEHDLIDRSAGRKIACPVLVVRGSMHTPTPLLPTWMRWTDQVKEHALNCGHFVAEEDPAGCADALINFFCRET